MRRDELSWLDISGLVSSAETQLVAKLEALRKELNRDLQLGLWELEAHHAIYPPGGFYRRHLDRFRDDDARVVSIVLYLNEGWVSEDGGELAIYRAPGDEKPALIVEPRGGSLVCFLSDRIEHEVLESHRRERFSVAGWFRRREIEVLP